MATPEDAVRMMLNNLEIAQGMELGAFRNDESMRLGCRERKVSSASAVEVDQMGILGEMATKKLFRDNSPLTMNTFTSVPDVRDYEVRTRGSHHYELLIRPRDHLERIYILVTTEHMRLHDGLFIIRGWLVGNEAAAITDLKTYGGGPPAWFVPHSMLHPIRTLIRPVEYQFDGPQGILI